MSKIKELVIPVLKDIKADMAKLDDKIDDVAKHILEQGERLQKIENYMTYHMGITHQHRHDIDEHKISLDTLKSKLSEIKNRIEQLEKTEKPEKPEKRTQ
jgi:hypothetical protein